MVPVVMAVATKSVVTTLAEVAIGACIGKAICKAIKKMEECSNSNQSEKKEEKRLNREVGLG